MKFNGFWFILYVKWIIVKRSLKTRKNLLKRKKSENSFWPKRDVHVINWLGFVVLLWITDTALVNGQICRIQFHNTQMNRWVQGLYLIRGVRWLRFIKIFILTNFLVKPLQVLCISKKLKSKFGLQCKFALETISTAINHWYFKYPPQNLIQWHLSHSEISTRLI